MQPPCHRVRAMLRLTWVKTSLFERPISARRIALGRVQFPLFKHRTVAPNNESLPERHITFRCVRGCESSALAVSNRVRISCTLRKILDCRFAEP
jgi:hypothetical protein